MTSMWLQALAASEDKLIIVKYQLLMQRVMSVQLNLFHWWIWVGEWFGTRSANTDCTRYTDFHYRCVYRCTCSTNNSPQSTAQPGETESQAAYMHLIDHRRL